MAIAFWICREGHQPRWTVRRDNQLYGEYLDKEQARLDAVDAARDIADAGQEVEVWDRSTAAPVLLAEGQR